MIMFVAVMARKRQADYRAKCMLMGSCGGAQESTLRVRSYLIDAARIEKETGVRNSCLTEVPLGQSPREPSYTLEYQTRGQRIRGIDLF